jgi:two-component system sensor histidine kinase KdpD
LLLEHPLAALIGKPLAVMVAPGSQPAVFRALRELVAGSGFADLEIELVRRRSGPLATWMRGAGSPDASATVTTVRWVVRDVSERNAVRALLERANREKDAFLLALSHDLRSPVSAISGFLEVLSDDPGRVSAEDRAAAFESMRDSAHSIETVIANLLDVDRLGRGNVRLIRRPTDVVELVMRCLKEDRLQGRVRLDVVPVIALIDPGLTERILHNLLANALRHCPPEAGIVIHIRPTADGTLIEVDDTGPGIPADAKEAVFELFYHVEEGSGRGVGLYLVRQFSELHDGRAWIEDRPGGGTSVRVLLPD